jgi:methionyl-tRNA synthetase
MNDKKSFYITTAIAYANGLPHIGHAFEFAMTDVIARYRKNTEIVYFVTGMDEHGQKIENKAKEEGVPLQEFVDRYATSFQALDKELGVDYDFFVRTSDKEKHYRGAQMLWNKLSEKGDLEKRTYSALYCVGCEEFKTEKDLDEEGRCPIHLVKPEVVEEENYFFKLSNYTESIKDKVQNDQIKIYPQSRKNEIMALLERGLEDVSFSRPVSKVSWGIPVPGDETQIMYVWCDALANYITALGYGTDEFKEDLWNNTTHVIGKDILRFHAAIWPGMLLSAGLALPKRILVHGHITSGGQKMSKSIGNVIDPQEVIELFNPATEYAGEALRFVLLHEIPSFEDGDVTMESIKSVYTSYLVNGIGNMTSRIMKLSTTYGVNTTESKKVLLSEYLDKFDVKNALNALTDACNMLDKKIQDTEPFKVVKVDEAKGKAMIAELLSELHGIAEALQVFMPQTSAKILECISENKMPEKPLFARLS